MATPPSARTARPAPATSGRSSERRTRRAEPGGSVCEDVHCAGGGGIGCGVGTRGLGGTGGAAAASGSGGTLGAAFEGSGGGTGLVGRAGGSGGALGETAGASAWRATAIAARMSPAEAKRFSRSFSSDRFTTATTPVGTSGTQRRTGGACRWTTWKRTLGVESDSKGLWPVSSS